MFKHILVPVDGSTLSWRASEMASQLAADYGARMTVLNVARKFKVPDRLKQYLDAEHLTGEPILAIDDATERLIQDIVKEARTKGVKRVEAKFKEGHPSRTIVTYAKEHDCDAIIMGSRGLTEIEGALLGSVSHKVASLAHCTVIIVR